MDWPRGGVGHVHTGDGHRHDTRPAGAGHAGHPHRHAPGIHAAVVDGDDLEPDGLAFRSERGDRRPVPCARDCGCGCRLSVRIKLLLRDLVSSIGCPEPCQIKSVTGRAEQESDEDLLHHCGLNAA